MVSKAIRRTEFKTLAQWRAAHGLTQVQAAAVLGTQQSIYCKWENGVSHPNRDIVAAVARKTGVSVLDLLGVAA